MDTNNRIGEIVPCDRCGECVQPSLAYTGDLASVISKCFPQVRRLTYCWPCLQVWRSERNGEAMAWWERDRKLWGQYKRKELRFQDLPSDFYKDNKSWIDKEESSRRQKTEDNQARRRVKGGLE